MALTFLERKPDRGLGNIRSSPGDPWRNIDWVLLMTQGVPLVDLLVVVGLLLSLAAARAAFAVHVDLPSTSAPRHPVLFCNPKSGGGKAMRFALAQEAG